MTVLTGACVVTPEGILRPGWVAITGRIISAVGTGPPPPGESWTDLAGAWLLPGFIDLHVHGGGGHDFGASPEAMAAGVAYHCWHGTTRTLVSLITASVAQLREQLGWVAALTARRAGPDGQVLGAHLEGPFLAPARCGAQDPRYLLAPDPAVWERLRAAGAGTVRMVTLAPEVPGGLDLVDHIVGSGVVVAVGHTDATYTQARAAFARGATVLTHAFNAMRPPHHREPGPVPAALEAGAVCEIINDGVHVHPAMVRLVPHRQLALVTDAIDAAGQGDGTYRLGRREVRVVAGQARLVEGGALAGSTLTMEQAVRRAVREVGLPMAAASTAASGTPARVLGIADRCGAIAPGLDADLVVLDPELRVTRVMVQGVWAR